MKLKVEDLTVSFANEDELDKVVDYLEKTHSFTQVSVPFDKEVTRNVAQVLYDSRYSEGMILTVQHKENIVGIFVAMKAPYLFAQGYNAVEVFFFIDKNARHRNLSVYLLEIYEGWCKKTGCVEASLTLRNESPETVEKLYTHKGYKYREKFFVKDI